jgi:hypothetical protein
MSDTGTNGYFFPMNETLCKLCAHRMFRLVVPLDIADFGLDEEDVMAMDLDDDDEILIEQHTCLVLQQDMDYLVKECSHYKDRQDVSIFRSNPYE